VSFVWACAMLITVVTGIPVALQLRRHPKGLTVLFFLEMWERFSYYGMRALLIFYLTQHFLFSDTTAQGHYGAFTSLVYLLPLVGGIVADRLIGSRKAVALGACLLVAGHGLMAIETPAAHQVLTYHGASYIFERPALGDEGPSALIVANKGYRYQTTAQGGLVITGLPQSASIPAVLPAGSFTLTVVSPPATQVNSLFLALAFVVMGVGFLKPNVAALVGSLYGNEDDRRDRGFTLYYYGINLGAFWAALVCGWLSQTVGWWAGFGAAGVGMVLGLIVFWSGRRSLVGHGDPPNPSLLARPLWRIFNRQHAVYAGALIGVVIISTVLQYNAVIGSVLTAASTAAIGYCVVFMVRSCSPTERKNLGFALFLVAIAVVFSTLNEQAGSSLNQFAERNTQLSLWGSEALSPAQTQSINGAFILIGAPIFAALWSLLDRSGLEPSPLVKFALALVLAGAGFLFLGASENFADSFSRVPLLFLSTTYLLLALGELCLTPVGLSQMTRLAPMALSSTLLAVWYLSLSWAQWLGSKIAMLTAANTIAGEVTDPARALARYTEVFATVGWSALGLGVGLGLVATTKSGLLSRWRRPA
jgi:proton-dependent oligopeptide transporter, POT family